MPITKKTFKNVLSLAFLFLYFNGISAFLNKDQFQSEGIILVDPYGLGGFTVLFEKNAHASFYPASTTKIATAAYTLENAQELLDQPIAAHKEALISITYACKEKANFKKPAYWLEPDGTHINIKPGEILTLRTLLYGTLLSSGNDAANVIAHALTGSISSFTNMLNSYMKKLGCQKTHFCNPHGLHHPDHKTCAFDMALLTAHAMQIPLFKTIVSTVRYTRPKTNKQNSMVLLQTNKLLRPGNFFYPKAIGVKTGYTLKAQKNLVAAAEHEGRILIAVLLKCKDRNAIFQEAVKLFESAFQEEKIERRLLKAGTQKYVLDLCGAAQPIETNLLQDVVVEYYPSERPLFSAAVHWQELSLPITKGQHIGDVNIYVNKALIDAVPLYAERDVSCTWTYWLKSWFYTESNAKI